MRFSVFLLSALGFIPGIPITLAQAQSAPAAATGAAMADAADPQAKVPVLPYHSVFEGVTKGLIGDTTDWRESNDQVGQFKRGHVDVLKWEEQNVKGKAGASAPRHDGQGQTVQKP